MNQSLYHKLQMKNYLVILLLWFREVLYLVEFAKQAPGSKSNTMLNINLKSQYIILELSYLQNLKCCKVLLGNTYLYIAS